MFDHLSPAISCMQEVPLLPTTGCMKICSDDNQGRFFVASKDINKDEVILVQYPYAWAVFEDWKTRTCRYCMGFIENTKRLKKCRKCNQVYYCGVECQRSDSREHLVHECAILAQLFSTTDSNLSEDLCMEMKVLIRLLSRRRVEILSPEGGILTWDREHSFDDYLQLVCNVDQFEPEAIECISYWITSYVKQMGDYMYERANSTYQSKVEPELSADLIAMICRNRLNTFAYGNGSFEEAQGFGVYVRASLFNHCCSPNIVLRTMPPGCEDLAPLMGGEPPKRANPAGPLLVFTAAKFIPAGDMLTISYLDNGMMEPGLIDDVDFEIPQHERDQFTLQYRRKELQNNYLFHCKCERCVKEEKEVDDSSAHVERLATSSSICKVEEPKAIESITTMKETINEPSILSDYFQSLLGTKQTIQTRKGKLSFEVKGFSTQISEHSNKIIQLALIQMDGKEDVDSIPLKHLLSALPE